jgi:hypothetical protein
MSVRSFHSVFMVTAVAGAVLGCYLVSLRVASERGALDRVERQIVQTQYDIRLLQTEIGTRGRLAQLERWNVRVLSLSAPSADQILGDKFQLARLITPETRPALDAPVILATAPAPEPAKPLGDSPEANGAKPSGASGTGEILHRAGLKVVPSGAAGAGAKAATSKQAQPEPVQALKPQQAQPAQAKPSGAETKPPIRPATVVATRPATPAATRPATRPAATAATSAGTIDPLAPLAEGDPAIEGSRTGR